MPRVVIANLSEKALDVQGESRSLLQHLHDHGLDWMHACGAKGRCTTCKCIVLEGIESLSAETKPELKYRAQGVLRKNERLACQVMITGDVRISVPEEYKLPHLHYTF